MLSYRTCLRHASNGQRRYYAASSKHDGPRDYNSAVSMLNALQSNFSIVEAIRKQGPRSNSSAIPDMIAWARRIGYEPVELDTVNPIHIAGTKGKGSTSSFISSILAQYLPSKRSIHAERLPSSVGLYTSPHLRFVRERIRINNEPISDQAFARYFWEVWDRLEGVDRMPVYFHYLTLMALHCFMQEKVGSAVIECGIGGEFDTTNILNRPSVTGVTNLGIDHEALLGNTIEQIAWHKAGIFKPDVPAFSVAQPDNALEVLHERAREKGTQLYVVPVHLELEKFQLGLQGHFQRHNASLAIAICAAHLQRLGYMGLPNPYDSSSKLPTEFVKGLQTTRLGGRCDMRFDSKLSKLRWHIDGGHTLESIDVAGRWYADCLRKVEGREGSRILIFNQQTRDASLLARRLHSTLAAAMNDARPFSSAIFCPNTTYRDAGYKTDLVSINANKDDISSLRVQQELASIWSDIDPDCKVLVVPTIEDAIARARDIAGNGRCDILATGSLHLVGGLIEVLEDEIERSDK